MNPKLITIPLLLLFLIILSIKTVDAARNDVTTKIRSLGIPYKSRYQSNAQIYARNIWDMIIFKEKIFLGAGNSSNYGPASNAGPVPVIMLDPKTEAFETSFSVDDEQIDKFFIHNDDLLIPGHDPREDWRFGNLYLTKNGTSWSKYRTIPEGVHVYSLTDFKGMLFAGLGTRSGGSVVVSEDHGAKWKKTDINSSRIYDLIMVDEKLYAIGTFFTNYLIQGAADNDKILPYPVQEYTEDFSFKPRADLSARSVFFPAGRYVDGQFTFLKISDHIQYRKKCIFIGAVVHNDHQSLPFGVYAAESFEKDNIRIFQLQIPLNSIPWDIFQENGKVFILLDHPDRSPREISVIASSDLQNWTEVLYFQAPTFSRSFVKIDNVFYFSLGSEVKDPFNGKQEELSQHTGQILVLEMDK